MASQSKTLTPPLAVGRLAYGTFWRIEPGGVSEYDASQVLWKALQDTGKVKEDDDLSDHIDVLVEDYGAHVTYVDKTYTIFFGHIIDDISTSENKFDEMALLRIMDLKTGNLRDDVKKSVKELIEKIPYSLRESFSSPQFFIAWGQA